MKKISAKKLMKAINEKCDECTSCRADCPLFCYAYLEERQGWQPKPRAENKTYVVRT